MNINIFLSSLPKMVANCWRMASLLLFLSLLSIAVFVPDPEEEEEGDRVTEVVPGLKKGKLYKTILSHEMFICF